MKGEYRMEVLSLWGESVKSATFLQQFNADIQPRKLTRPVSNRVAMLKVKMREQE